VTSSRLTDLMNPEDSRRTFRLEDAASVLRRRWLPILLCLLLTTGVAFALAKRQTKLYTATAYLVFNQNQLGAQVAGLQATGSADPQLQQSTDVELVQLGDAAGTAAEIGHGATPESVSRSLKISAEGLTNVVAVAATSSAPDLAASTANTYSKLFVTDQQSSNASYFKRALQLVRKQLAALSPRQRVGSSGLALQDRAQSLEILSQTQSGGGDVQVAHTAGVPTSPSSPNVKKTTLLGFVFGLLIALALVALLERFDRRIKDADELERRFDLPLLGAVPSNGSYREHTAAHQGGALTPLPRRQSEVFRMLRARLRYYNVDRDLRLVLLTSALPGEGKTTIVQNLAEAAAATGERVLLIEADLHRPMLAERLGLRPFPGLSEALISAEDVADAVQTVSVVSDPGDQGVVGDSFSVLVAGAPPPNPAELIESQAMVELLSWAASYYDLVLIDTPPLSAVPDVIPLVTLVHGVVLVCRLGKSTRDGVTRMKRDLASLQAKVLGLVANGVEGRDSEYGYGYYASSEDDLPPGGDSSRGTVRTAPR
jgi:succinoglycan biosynthesis transport protein ExoP